MSFKVGDIIVGTRNHNEGIRREILEVRPTGYTWRYPDVPERDFWSENSSDPLLELGWEVEVGSPNTQGEE